jgi:metal-dependent HD superfamily phosphatase/phosphodiesterase
MTEKEFQLYNDIKRKLNELNEFSIEEKERFITIFGQMYLNNMLTSRMKWSANKDKEVGLNRHDILHALTVCYNSLQLFDHFCLKSNSAKSIVKPFLVTSGYSLELALISVMMSAYFHDIGRSFFPNPNDREEIASKEAHNVYSVKLWEEFGNDTNIFIDDRTAVYDLKLIIGACIGNHGGDKKVSTLEESIVILADGFDTDKDRIQPDFDILTELSGKDEKPIEYFSCKDIQEVKIEDIGKEAITFCFMITGDGAIKKIWDFIKRLKNTVFNSEENKYLVKVKIKHMKVEDHPHWKSDEIIIWPRPPQWASCLE